MAKVAVFGNGIIGAATATLLSWLDHDVMVYDQNPDKTQVSFGDMLDALPSMDYVFSVVPTDDCSEGLDMSLTKDVVLLVKRRCKQSCMFVQRSSSMPGQAAELAAIWPNYMVFPSFAYRKTAGEDEVRPPKVVLGGTSRMSLILASADLKLDRLKAPVFYGSLQDAEAAKIYSNLFQCLLLGAWNELKYAYTDVDSEFVMETVIQEKNLASIKRYHGKAWGIDGRMESDLRAFNAHADVEVPSIFNALMISNETLRFDRGEERRSGAELAEHSFKGFVSPTLMDEEDLPWRK